MPQNSKMLIGAVVAAALAFAVYYGLITPQSASNIQNQANQTLGSTPASQQAPISPTAQPPMPGNPVPQNTQTTPR
jgi:hypothetical protein